MTRHEIVAALDQEIQRLETARTLIRNSRDVVSAITVRNGYAKPAVRRQISPEGRRRIIEAQRRRWAKQKKEESAKSK
jgi:transcriptional regulator GlxA family with amidase domain